MMGGVPGVLCHGLRDVPPPQTTHHTCFVFNLVQIVLEQTLRLVEIFVV